MQQKRQPIRVTQISKQCKAQHPRRGLATFARWRCHCTDLLNTLVSGFSFNFVQNLISQQLFALYFDSLITIACLAVFP